MLICWKVGVPRRKCPLHFGTGSDGVGHRFELRQQAVAKTFHQAAAPARQYFGGCYTDKVCPPANGVRLVLPHETYRLDEVDQQHDRLLPHEFDACTSRAKSLGVSLLASVDRIIGHVDPTARLRPCVSDGRQPQAKRGWESSAAQTCTRRASRSARSRRDRTRNAANPGLPSTRMLLPTPLLARNPPLAWC